MSARPKHMLILLGGMYHDFDGFASAMASLFEPEGWMVEATYDLDVLTRLDALGCRVLLSYTCLTRNEPGQGKPTPDRLTDEQIRGLSGWVRGGGAVLAAHCATVIGESSPELGQLLGGSFISHPPPFAFTVYPVFGKHPIIRDIPAFEVYDEFYTQHCEPSAEIHMVALHQEIAHPMVWSKREGAGRVAHIAPGHFSEVWDDPLYQRLMVQAINWLT